MISGTTRTGFSCTLDERIKTDWRLIEYYELINSKNEAEQVRGCVGLMHLMFQEDHGDAIKKHVMELNDGFCPANKLMEEVEDIFQFDEDLKK